MGLSPGEARGPDQKKNPLSFGYRWSILREQRFFFGQKRFVEGVECKTLFCRVHSARPLLICNYRTHYIKYDMEKILKLGGILNGQLCSKFDAAVKKLVAHVSALV